MANPTVLLPSCKSTTQRALICAALGSGEVVLQNVSRADDCLSLRRCLQTLGVSITPLEIDDDWLIRGCAGNMPKKEAVLDCGAGGTTFRFLWALCATQRGDYKFRVDEQLKGRPHEPLFESTSQLNCQFESTDDGWHLDSRNWQPCDITVDCEVSSQFVSAFVLAQFHSVTFGVESSTDKQMPYFELTQKIMGQFEKRPESYSIPADFSAAMYFAGLALVNKSTVYFARDICLDHPEKYAYEFLQKHFGLRWTDSSFVVDRVIQTNGESPLNYDVALAPDASLLVAVVCRIFSQDVGFAGSESLQHKESDRQHALHSLQYAVDEIDSLQDHRIAMAAAVLQLAFPQLRINGRDCVSKSFPDFFKQWSQFA
jgi:3-phosphoshikimate 1-carboxyvinyltransferase